MNYLPLTNVKQKFRIFTSLTTIMKIYVVLKEFCYWMKS